MLLLTLVAVAGLEPTIPRLMCALPGVLPLTLHGNIKARTSHRAGHISIFSFDTNHISSTASTSATIVSVLI